MARRNPSQCIGHGACKAACPSDAITLVFRTETRGVELPYVGPASLRVRIVIRPRYFQNAWKTGSMRIILFG
jgi:ferredoxin